MDGTVLEFPNQMMPSMKRLIDDVPVLESHNQLIPPMQMRPSIQRLIDDVPVLESHNQLIPRMQSLIHDVPGTVLEFRYQLIPPLQNLIDDVPGEREKLKNYCLPEMRERVSMPANIKELLSAYEFVIDMPGFKSEKIKAQVEDGKKLTITGERFRDDEIDKEGDKYHCMERSMGKFLRAFPLPVKANPENISAVYRDGVLTVTVQKLPAAESKYPKTIEIEMA